MNAVLGWWFHGAILLGCVLLAVQNWRFFGRSNSARWMYGIWLAVAGAAGTWIAAHPTVPVPPFVLPLSIVALSVLLTIFVRRDSTMRAAADAAQLPQWFGLQRLRAYFGAVILAAAFSGVVPWGFALSAGLGDIAVGIAAFWLHRAQVKSAGAGWAFTLLGMVDLLNAARLAVVVIAPWVAATGTPGVLVLLPFFGVPIMISNHIQTLRYLLKACDGRSASAPGARFV